MTTTTATTTGGGAGHSGNHHHNIHHHSFHHSHNHHHNAAAHHPHGNGATTSTSSCNLPLLMGLTHSHPSMAKSILNDALRGEESMCIVRRTLVDWFHRRRRRREQEGGGTVAGGCCNKVDDKSMGPTESTMMDTRTTEKTTHSCGNRRQLSEVSSSLEGSVATESPERRPPARKRQRREEDKEKDKMVDYVRHHRGRQNHDDFQHWLWKSLRSYSTSERCATARLIHSVIASSSSVPASNVSALASDSTSGQKMIASGVKSVASTLAIKGHYMVHRIVAQLVMMMDRHVVISEGMMQQNHISFSSMEALSQQPRLAMEWVALIEHCLFGCDRAATGGGAGTTGKDKTSVTVSGGMAKSLTSMTRTSSTTPSSTALPSFCIATPAGSALVFWKWWPWLTNSIWIIASRRLTMTHNHHGNGSSGVGGALSTTMSYSSEAGPPTHSPSVPTNDTTTMTTSTTRLLSSTSSSSLSSQDMVAATIRALVHLATMLCLSCPEVGSNSLPDLLAYNQKCLWSIDTTSTSNDEITDSSNNIGNQSPGGVAGEKIVASFSPLACLIGAYHCISDPNRVPPSRVVEQTVEALSKLIDPNTVPTCTEPNAQAASAPSSDGTRKHHHHHSQQRNASSSTSGGGPSRPHRSTVGRSRSSKSVSRRRRYRLASATRTSTTAPGFNSSSDPQEQQQQQDASEGLGAVVAAVAGMRGADKPPSASISSAAAAVAAAAIGVVDGSSPLRPHDDAEDDDGDEDDKNEDEADGGGNVVSVAVAEDDHHDHDVIVGRGADDEDDVGVAYEGCRTAGASGSNNENEHRCGDDDDNDEEEEDDDDDDDDENHDDDMDDEIMDDDMEGVQVDDEVGNAAAAAMPKHGEDPEIMSREALEGEKILDGGRDVEDEIEDDDDNEDEEEDDEQDHDDLDDCDDDHYAEVEDEDIDSMAEDDDDPDGGNRDAELSVRLEEQVIAIDDDVPVEMDLEELTAVVGGASEAGAPDRSAVVGTSATDSTVEEPQSSGSQKKKTAGKKTPPPLSPSVPERRRMFVKASMQVLDMQYTNTALKSAFVRRNYLSVSAENLLLSSINKVIKPPKNPFNTKIIMRRAPSQEEFFRGSLSRNPIALSSLKPSGQSSRTESYEPTVADLRQHIADELQMSDSAELIEIIVANKILEVNLKLRVVHQVLWRNHLMESSSSGLSGGMPGASGTSYLSAGSGLSLIFSSGSSDGGMRRGITVDTPLSSLPPVVATYRLAGVDGEATEDTVTTTDLVDPEAPVLDASPEELERRLESEFGTTRLVTNGRGVQVLLRLIQTHVADTLRCIRRDDVGCSDGQLNAARSKFAASPPCEGLTLLRYCSKLSSNRKIFLRARAPTILLTMLLDVLKALEDASSGSEGETAKSNPTAEILQELIEVLTSDISTSSSSEGDNSSHVDAGYESPTQQDETSMPLLLDSIKTISLSTPLRAIIGKLLPYLTYGQADLSRELAQQFDSHIDTEALAQCEDEHSPKDKKSILMNTFVDTAISLPPSDVCNSLRLELINCGFIERLARMIITDMPKQPPSWSPALWEKGELTDSPTKKKAKKSGKRPQLDDAWRLYFHRGGIKTAFRILTGLCKKHPPTQSRIAASSDFLRSCHWLEATSDNDVADITTNGLGLVAETLLDDVIDGNDEVGKLVEAVRKKTRNRKKELAQERRNRALMKMSSFGPMANQGSPSASATRPQASVRDNAASILAPVFGLIRESNAAEASAKSKGGKNQPSEKPAWLAEAEMMEDETGLTCAVCQEGRTLQPSELLGLYAFVKKISVPTEQFGTRSGIDGSSLLKSLQSATFPPSVAGMPCLTVWLSSGKAAGEEVTEISSCSLTVGSGVRRSTLFTTTVSAGNAIHVSCHRKARQADRGHPKAPKSEWEGAALRNSRVKCNVILPLVSSRSSKVPLMAVDSALTDHQTALANLLGTTPKSMLWTVLHDVRFLLLRMAYGETLNADCGGGSLSSNCQLLFYQILMADMFDQDAQVDQPGQSKHARGLSCGLLAACVIETAKEYEDGVSNLASGIADAAPMAALTSVIFHNFRPGNDNATAVAATAAAAAAVASASSSEAAADVAADVSGDMTSNENWSEPHPKRQWILGREYFLMALLISAGRRHALGVEGSGCQLNRGGGGSSRQRSSFFAEWEVVHDGDGVDNDDDDDDDDEENDEEEQQQQQQRDMDAEGGTSRAGEAVSGGSGEAGKDKETKKVITSVSDTSRLSIEDFQSAIRPMITYFAIVDQLSTEFTLSMDDVSIQGSAERLVHVIEDCQRSKSIYELVQKVKITIEPDKMIDLLQKGMMVASS